ncbi:ABC transporter permease [Mameliella sediminis]|uniref:ABC transporter permease n=1 Tax=Mameliella sediminis TaxID=2836866 RepID=UPI001C45ECBE|nr:ABC transporter permease [Mameliella sediminis]MBY6116726.1 ABC transporter permease [Antarctobacter heliothermus]MBY6146479.1 ABC transporter permease [Mameliella alba]MBV7396381.1 ABC transporter permease [Mameliella sediminis]MBY6162707.1 ABC transporter permease [Mameliella alba]MBY6170970.1 ABC transporter permease [Mameliella alba]
MAQRHLTTIASLTLLALVLLAWEYLPTALEVPRFIIPTLSDCLAEFKRMWAFEGLWGHIVSTALYTVLGFAIGSLLGAVLGYLLGMSAFWEKVLSPYILALQIAPKVAFAPLFIMWFGYNSMPKLLVTVLIVFFPVLVNVLQAMRTVDRDLINLARAYNLSRLGIFWKIEMPSTVPNLMAGLRIASTLAVIGVTVGELVGGNVGLGFLISYGGGQANAAMVFNAIILLTVIGFLLYSVLVQIEERVLHYLPKAHG